MRVSKNIRTPLTLLFLITLFIIAPKSLHMTGSITNQVKKSGVRITYEIYVKEPPQKEMNIKATFSNIKSPLVLDIGFMGRYKRPDLTYICNISFYDFLGKKLKWSVINNYTLKVFSDTTNVIGYYSINLTKGETRNTEVRGMGGIASGYTIFLVPTNQPVEKAKVKFILPHPWKVVSIYPYDGEWFNITPVNYLDLNLELKVSGWYFGKILFDHTLHYPDGFKIRVVAFDYMPLPFWNVYMNRTPLQQAIMIANDTYKIYKVVKRIFGGFPFKEIMLVGPDYWQAGLSYSVFSLMGWNYYNEIAHALIHCYEKGWPSRIVFSGTGHSLLREGIPTYAEAFVTAEALNDTIWKGLAYERMLQYLRSKYFGTLYTRNEKQYLLGLVYTYLLDNEIKRVTNNQKSLYDFLNLLWSKYKDVSYKKPVIVTDDEILKILKELTGKDFSDFYKRNNLNPYNMSVEPFKRLRDIFNRYVDQVSKIIYNGHRSAYFINLELLSAKGNFNFNYGFMYSDNMLLFSKYAKTHYSISSRTLTKEDIISMLNNVTGKDHRNMFEFYRQFGFEIDPKDLTEYLRTYSVRTKFDANALKLSPHHITLNHTTKIFGEILNKDFANADRFYLQVGVYSLPEGIKNVTDLVRGEGVKYLFTHEGSYGYGLINISLFELPKIIRGNKTYTSFTLTYPYNDSGVIYWVFSASYKHDKPCYNGFIGTRKMYFQDSLLLLFEKKTNVKPALKDSPKGMFWRTFSKLPTNIPHLR